MSQLINLDSLDQVQETDAREVGIDQGQETGAREEELGQGQETEAQEEGLGQEQDTERREEEQQEHPLLTQGHCIHKYKISPAGDVGMGEVDEPIYFLKIQTSTRPIKLKLRRF
jgi:hypothetical protein